MGHFIGYSKSFQLLNHSPFATVTTELICHFVFLVSILPCSGNDLVVFPWGFTSLPLSLCDLRKLDLPSGLLGKHFTDTPPGRNWNHSDSPSSLTSSILYLLLHPSQSLRSCILHSCARAECGTPTAPKFYCYSPFLLQTLPVGSWVCCFLVTAKQPFPICLVVF